MTGAAGWRRQLIQASDTSTVTTCEEEPGQDTGLCWAMNHGFGSVCGPSSSRAANDSGAAKGFRFSERRQAGQIRGFERLHPAGLSLAMTGPHDGRVLESGLPNGRQIRWSTDRCAICARRFTGHTSAEGRCTLRPALCSLGVGDGYQRAGEAAVRRRSTGGLFMQRKRRSWLADACSTFESIGRGRPFYWALGIALLCIMDAGNDAGGGTKAAMELGEWTAAVLGDRRTDGRTERRYEKIAERERRGTRGSGGVNNGRAWERCDIHIHAGREPQRFACARRE